jgi:hypothetical protein
MASSNGMTLSSKVRAGVYRSILRKNDKPFQSREIREENGWSEESAEARRMHAVIQGLKEDGVIRQTGPEERKRHQYLMLVPEKAAVLRQRLGRVTDRSPATNGTPESDAPTPPASGPQRVRYLEDRVAELEARAALDDELLREIVVKLDGLDVIRTKVDDLHREWIGA